MARLRDKSAVITGGAQGIGWEIAKRFLEEGASVVIFDQDGKLAAQSAEQLASSGGNITAVVGDVSRRQDVRRAVETCTNSFGRLDVMVAHAGIADAQPLLEIDDRSWQRILDVNLTGVFLCTQEAGKVMAETGGGAIVVTASTNAFWVEQNLAHYNTSKGGVVALVRSAGIDLAQYGVRVNAVAPGVVKTRIAAWVTEDPDKAADYLKRIPLNRFGETPDVANAALFLASEESSYMTGQALILDGGLTLGMAMEPSEVPLPGSARADIPSTTDERP